MKHPTYIILLLFITFSSLSCTKGFLDVTDNSNLNKQNYVKDLNSMQDFMNGIYVQLSIKCEFSSNTAYAELIADDLKVSSTSTTLALHNNWSQQADAVNPTNYISMNGLWKDHYLIIRSCNFVIEDIEKYKSENPEKANNIKGQAYALRALMHLKLVNIFAQNYTFTPTASHPGIPYITTSDITKPYSRQTVAEVYNNLINDLQSAITLLPPTIADCRIMNLATAKGLLSRTYFYKGDYAQAKSLAIELMNQFTLMKIAEGYPTDIFKNKNPEVLFQITPIYQGELLSQFLGLFFELDYYRATADIAMLLKENSKDIRASWVDNTEGYWKVKKFPEGAAGGLGILPSTDYYVPVVRLAELYLIASESSAKTNDEENARLYLNAIRKRADPSIPDITATGEALLDLIYKERRKELCFEGHRMWDLQRLKKGVYRTDVVTGFQTSLPYPNNKAIAPIPGQDVTQMGLPQNPGY